MVWNVLIPAAASIGGALIGSDSQSDAARAQQQAAEDSNETQLQISDDQLAFSREMLDVQLREDQAARERTAANLYPQQRAGNSALQKLTDLYGLGDIYAAPEAGSLGGQGAFYADNPYDVQLVNSLASMTPGQVEAYRDMALGEYSDMAGATYFDRVAPRREQMSGVLPSANTAEQAPVDYRNLFTGGLL